MSVVSRYIDVQQFLPRRRVYTFPQTVDDNNDVKPPDFTMAETRSGYETRTARSIMKPVTDAPPKPNYVPLKCDQVNSHAVGASLFNAPVLGDIQKLRSSTERPIGDLQMEDLRYRKYKVSTEYAPHLRLDNPDREIEALVRSYRMPTTLLVNPVAEPAAESYRR